MNKADAVLMQAIEANGLADRLTQLDRETAFLVLKQARELEARGRTIVHLEIGEPDFSSPAEVDQATIQAIKDGQTHYVGSQGIPELLEAIAADVSETRGISVDPSNVIMTVGAKEVISFTILSLVNPGEEVIYATPSYPIYPSLINLFGGVPRPLRLRPEIGFNLELDEFESLLGENTKLIILNYPHNPTGCIFRPKALKRVVELAAERGIWILADEVYKDIIYDDAFTSVATLKGGLDHIILMDGFSKSFAMTGYRIGYAVVPDCLRKPFVDLCNNMHSCVTSFVQVGAIAALADPTGEVRRLIQQRRLEFRARRDLICEGLRHIPSFRLTATPPGAFYVFPDIRETGLTSDVLEQRLLIEGGVAGLSGTAFGPEGEGFLRLSYANSQDNIKLALEWIATFVGKL
ncbi:MAG: pyridoxal phosphate-dependent aminotransferase [Patescibacteria group bacterium]|jgi:aspartate/methionine/tyrosine aminotransferase